MSLITQAVNFGAYSLDSVDHALGGTSNLAASSEIWTGDVGLGGNTLAPPDVQAAQQADQTADVAGSENSQIATQNAQIASAAGSVLGGLAIGSGVLVVVAILAVGGLAWWLAAHPKIVEKIL